MTKIDEIQAIIGVVVDGKWGPKSQAALDSVLHPLAATNVSGKASSFADPKDVAAFLRCKAKGKSDKECFKVGDNGIGYWGDDTKEGSGPSCAVAVSEMKAKWGSKDAARGKEILVTTAQSSVAVKVKDMMPENSPNGAVIDLNPDAAKALGLTPPFIVPCSWRWLG